MMVKSGLEKNILKFHEPLQSCCCPVQKKSGSVFSTGFIWLLQGPYIPKIADIAGIISFFTYNTNMKSITYVSDTGHEVLTFFVGSSYRCGSIGGWGGGIGFTGKPPRDPFGQARLVDHSAGPFTGSVIYLDVNKHHDTGGDVKRTKGWVHNIAQVLT